MEGVEKGAGDEVGGPDHGGGLDEEATSNATNGEADLGGGGQANVRRGSKGGLGVGKSLPSGWT